MLTRMPRRVAAVGAMAVVVLLVGAVPAHADGAVNPVNCDTQPTAAECVVTAIGAGDPGRPGDPGATTCHDPHGDTVPCYIQKWGWLGGDGCYYKPVDAATAALLDTPTPPAAWYVGTCVDLKTGYVLPITRLRLFARPAGQGLLVAEAVRRMRLPAPQIQTSPTAPAPQVVGVATWLWLRTTSWGVRSATASIPGLSVTATATPVRVVWSTGDAETVTCRGPGTAWTPGHHTQTGPACAHTYRTPSTVADGGVFTLRATITWRITWTGGGLTGTEPDLTTTSTLTLRVTESQAVNTGSIR